MDNSIAKAILLSYEEIEVDEANSNDIVIIFKMCDRRFALWCPDRDDITSSVIVWVLDDASFDQPHIMLREIYFDGASVLPAGKYRSICLYENGSVVNAVMSYEEKIIDAVERLIELMSLPPLAKEKEFQKEFLFYWNSVAEYGDREIYLGRDQSFSILSVYQNEKRLRYVASDVCLNDFDIVDDGGRKWQQRIDINAVFIPITDNRGILPPTKNHPWGKDEIIELLYGEKISHISDDAFRSLTSESIKYDTLDIVFTMSISSTWYTFVARVRFKGGNHKPLLDRVLNNISSVQALTCKRMDYGYLNQIIGNSTSNLEKHVLLIGAGSLGSYVASELVKNGFKYLTIFDGDLLTQENFMRWCYSGMIRNGKKASLLKLFIEMMHPEIHIVAHDENIESEKLIEEMNNADYIIFTIGSSDTQLKLNRILKKNGCKATVFFVWLEAGGQHSHILKVDYEAKGCFECLFTGTSGTKVNNKANVIDEEIIERSTIHNGCGGTRAAYGTSVLLRTTSVLLDVMNKEETDEHKNSFLVNISPEAVVYDESAFIEEDCLCCGI